MGFHYSLFYPKLRKKALAVLWYGGLGTVYHFALSTCLNLFISLKQWAPKTE